MLLEKTNIPGTVGDRSAIRVSEYSPSTGQETTGVAPLYGRREKKSEMHRYLQREEASEFRRAGLHIHNVDLKSHLRIHADQ